jgi:hypothetical protein
MKKGSTMLERLVTRAQALGYSVRTQSGSISLQKEGEDPHLFFFLEDAEAYLDRRHLTPVQRIRKQIAREAEQIGRIIHDAGAMLEQFDRAWQYYVAASISPQVITYREAKEIFQAHYAEGLNQHTSLRLKALRLRSEQIAREMTLPPGYTLDLTRGDGWIYPQYYGKDIPRTRDGQVYRFRTPESARQFVSKASGKLISILPTADVPVMPRYVTQKLYPVG